MTLLITAAPYLQHLRALRRCFLLWWFHFVNRYTTEDIFKKPQLNSEVLSHSLVHENLKKSSLGNCQKETFHMWSIVDVLARCSFQTSFVAYYVRLCCIIRSNTDCILLNGNFEDCALWVFISQWIERVLKPAVAHRPAFENHSSRKALKTCPHEIFLPFLPHSLLSWYLQRWHHTVITLWSC